MCPPLSLSPNVLWFSVKRLRDVPFESCGKSKQKQAEIRQNFENYVKLKDADETGLDIFLWDKKKTDESSGIFQSVVKSRENTDSATSEKVLE